MKAVKRTSAIYEHDPEAHDGIGKELARFDGIGDIVIRVQESAELERVRLPRKGEVFRFLPQASPTTEASWVRAQVVDIQMEPQFLDGRQGDLYGEAYAVKIL